MSPLTYRQEAGKKIMWDGIVYNSAEEADGKAEGYRSHGFEVYRFSEEGKHFVYTRRVSQEVPSV
ncbi:MAG: hypothetical protein KKC21_01115 [Nitrospinae bacterium]|nr:hypothetical protein [Nitrospinota bacterium]